MEIVKYIFLNIKIILWNEIKKKKMKTEEEKEDYATAIAYLNRLSDYLFMMCRYLHHSLAIPEIPWNSGK